MDYAEDLSLLMNAMTSLYDASLHKDFASSREHFSELLAFEVKKRPASISKKTELITKCDIALDYHNKAMDSISAGNYVRANQIYSFLNFLSFSISDTLSECISPDIKVKLEDEGVLDPKFMSLPETKESIDIVDRELNKQIALLKENICDSDKTVAILIGNITALIIENYTILTAIVKPQHDA